MNYLDIDNQHLQYAVSHFPAKVPIKVWLMVRFRAVASYSSANMVSSGEQAFERYIEATLPLIASLNGALSYQSHGCLSLTSGAVDNEWQQLLEIQLPDMDSLVSLLSMTDYVAAAKHQKAGVAHSQLLISY